MARAERHGRLQMKITVKQLRKIVKEELGQRQLTDSELRSGSVDISNMHPTKKPTSLKVGDKFSILYQGHYIDVTVTGIKISGMHWNNPSVRIQYDYDGQPVGKGTSEGSPKDFLGLWEE